MRCVFLEAGNNFLNTIYMGFVYKRVIVSHTLLFKLISRVLFLLLDLHFFIYNFVIFYSCGFVYIIL